MLLAAVMKINVVSNEKEQVVVLISLHGTKNQRDSTTPEADLIEDLVVD